MEILLVKSSDLQFVLVSHHPCLVNVDPAHYQEIMLPVASKILYLVISHTWETLQKWLATSSCFTYWPEGRSFKMCGFCTGRGGAKYWERWMSFCACFSSSHSLYSSFGDWCKVKVWFSKQPRVVNQRGWNPLPACQLLRGSALTLVQLAGATEINVTILVPILTFPLHAYKPGLTGHAAELPFGALTTVLWWAEQSAVSYSLAETSPCWAINGNCSCLRSSNM